MKALCTRCGTPFTQHAPSHRICLGCRWETRENPSGARLEREASRLIQQAAAKAAGGGIRIEHRTLQDALRVLGQRLPPQHASKLRLRTVDALNAAMRQRTGAGILVPVPMAKSLLRVLSGHATPKHLAVQRRRLVDELRRTLEARP